MNVPFVNVDPVQPRKICWFNDVDINSIGENQLAGDTSKKVKTDIAENFE